MPDHPRSLDTLETTTPHTRPSLASIDNIPQLKLEEPLGYLSPAHEEDYLCSLDAVLSHPLEPGAYDINDPANNDGRPFRPFDRSTALITDKEVSLKNPMSVTNWLRRNQPEVFLQDKYEERTNAKASRQAAAEAAAATGGPSGPGGHGGRSKRASMASVSTPVAPKADEDMADEETGFYHETGKSSARGTKRTRDDEPYRPKGGSSRPKRKRMSLAGEEGSRKKSRASNSAFDDGQDL